MLPGLSVQRLVLVEGDDAAFAGLGARMRGFGRVETMHRVVGPRGGDGRWHRFNLPELNGLTDRSSALVTRGWPRVRLVSTEAVAVVGLAELLAELRVSRDGTDANALAVDVPDLGDALFDALDAATLDPFDWLAWTSAGEHGAALPAAQRFESEAFGRVADAELAGADRLVVLRRDPLKQEAQRERRRLLGEIEVLRRHQEALDRSVARAEMKLDLVTELLGDAP